jgi:hypothetical protein
MRFVCLSLFTALCAKGQGLRVVLIMTKLKSSRQAPHGVFISPTKSGYFNYGPTFTEVFSPSGGKFPYIARFQNNIEVLCLLQTLKKKLVNIFFQKTIEFNPVDSQYFPPQGKASHRILSPKSGVLKRHDPTLGLLPSIFYCLRAFLIYQRVRVCFISFTRE